MSVEPGSDHFYKEVLRITREKALIWTDDEDEAEEVAQEVATDQWKRREEGRPCWDPSRPLEPYFAAAAWHRLQKLRRRRKRQAGPDERYEEQRANAEQAAGDLLGAAEVREIARVIQATLAAMSPERRETFLAVREEKLTYAQVAARRGVSLSTINNLVQGASRDFRRALLDLRGGHNA